MNPFQPVKLGPTAVRDRVIKAATFEGVMPRALVTPELIEYRQKVARDGAGMNTVPFFAVAPGLNDRRNDGMPDGLESEESLEIARMNQFELIIRRQ